MKLETIYKAILASRPTGYYYYIRKLSEEIMGMECICRAAAFQLEVRRLLGLGHFDDFSAILELCKNLNRGANK